MMRHFLSALAALVACAFAFAAQAAPNESSGPTGMERMQHWAADQDALLDARLAGLKAGLKLTADQDKLWPPFEMAVRDAAKLHMEHMKAMAERMQKMREMMQGKDKPEDTKDMGAAGEAVSPIDRLEAMGQRMAEGGDAIKKVAEGAKPLYAGLDDSQKRLFVLLGREMFMMGHGDRGMGMMRSGMRMMGGGMGMMGGKSDRMEQMGNRPEEEDSSDDE